MSMSVRESLGVGVNPRGGQVVHLSQRCRTETAGVEAEALSGFSNIPSYAHIVKICRNLGEGIRLPCSMKAGVSSP